MKPDDAIRDLHGLAELHDGRDEVKHGTTCMEAADLIKAMQAELSQKTQQLEAYKRTGLTPDEFKQSVDYVLELNKKCKEATGCTAEEIANIKDQLSTYKAAVLIWHEEDI